MSADKDNSFITEHFALVHSIAGRFRNRGIEYDELFSAGCVGLVKAGNNFDESRGLKFSTYAVPDNARRSIACAWGFASACFIKQL